MVNLIKKLFYKSISDFLKKDSDMAKNCSERAKVHRIAHYLENYINKHELFKGYVVDCEYNQVLINNCIQSKTLPQNFYNSDENHNRTFMPDLIVHKRNSKDNLLYCEFKNENESVLDQQKIDLLTNGKFEINYMLGTSIILNNLNVNNSLKKQIVFIENKKMQTFNNNYDKKKLQLMKEIPLIEFINIPKYKKTQLRSSLIQIIRYNSNISLYDFFFMSDDEILNLKNIGINRFPHLEEFKKIIYKDILYIYTNYIKSNNLTITEIIKDINKFIGSTEEIKLDTKYQIPINNRLLWSIFLHKLKGGSLTSFAHQLNITYNELAKIYRKLIRIQKNTFFDQYSNLFYREITKLHFSIDFLYTYEEIKLILGEDVEKVARYIKFINGHIEESWGKFSNIFRCDINKLEDRIHKEGKSPILKELEQCKFLTNTDKNYLEGIINDIID